MMEEVRMLLELEDKVMNYLESDKVFIANEERIKEFGKMLVVSKLLFRDSEVDVIEDPLDMGSLTIRIKDYSVSLLKKEEKEAFAKVLTAADIFDFYSDELDTITLDISWYNVFDVKVL